MKHLSVPDSRYDFLGRLAIVLQTQNIQMSFETANRGGHDYLTYGHKTNPKETINIDN